MSEHKTGRWVGRLALLVAGGAAGAALALWLALPVAEDPQLDGVYEYDNNDDGEIDERIHYDADVIRLIETDLDYDGVFDSRTFCEDGRAARSAVDSNFDGATDEWTTFDETGQISRVESDFNYDGKVDAWEHYAFGLFHRGEYDLDYDSKADKWSFAEHGRVIEQHWSLDLSGRVDRKTYYELGIKMREEVDEDHDGVFETGRRFDRFGNVIPTDAGPP